MIGGADFLQLLWFLLVGLLFMIFCFTEGFDYGVGMAVKFLAGNDQGKYLVTKTIGLRWDGNEVRLVTASGAMLVSSSDWHASLSSGYYILLFFTLFALTTGGVSSEFPAHIETRHGFRIWTGALSRGNLLAPFFLIMIFGSLIQSAPIDAQGNMGLSFWNIVSPLSIAVSVADVLPCLIHGINFLRLKIDGPELSERAAGLNGKLYLIAYLGGAVFTLLIFLRTDFSKLRPASSTVITLTTVALTAWSGIFLIKSKQVAVFVTSGSALAVVAGPLFDGLFPRVLIVTDLAHSPLTRTAANSKLTFEIMTIAAPILLSIALVYIIWPYVVFGRRIKIDQNA